MILLGLRSVFSSCRTSSPHLRPTSSFAECVAGTLLKPMGDMPSASMTIDMVLAVYCPPHAPAPGQATSSSSLRSESVMIPAAFAPTASKTSAKVTFLPRNVPGAMVPPYSTKPGKSRRASAMAAAGIVLSHPTTATTASNICPRHTSSMESAITSRLTSDAFIPSQPMVSPSLIAMVLNSIGVPPAARIPSFTCFASSRR